MWRAGGGWGSLGEHEAQFLTQSCLMNDHCCYCHPGGGLMADVFFLYFGQLDISIVIFRIKKKKIISWNKIKAVKDLQGAKGSQAAVLWNLFWELEADLQRRRPQEAGGCTCGFPNSELPAFEPTHHTDLRETPALQCRPRSPDTHTRALVSGRFLTAARNSSGGF